DEFVQKAGEHKLLYEKITPEGWPIAKRVGRHNTTFTKVAEVWTQMTPDKPFVVEGVPQYADLVARGLSPFLRDPKTVPAGRVAYE
ncbi:MAG: hypothetical protein ACM3RP_10955, partial [Chitinophagales bacterium]